MPTQSQHEPTRRAPANKQTRRAFFSGLDDLVYVVAVIAIVIVVNALIKDEGRWRIDLTEEGLYTLTDASIELAQKLPGEVKVKAFFSEGLQAPDHNLAQRVGDLLAEYAAYSEGKLDYEIVFPDDDEDEEAASGYGIQKIAVGQRDENQVGLRLVYKGIALVYGDKQEVIPEVSSNDNLEYELTKALKNLLLEDAHKIGIVTGFGGPASSPQFVGSLQQAFGDIYGKLVSIDGVDLSQDAAIPEDVDALVILNVSTPVSPEAQRAIDAFLMKGKSIAVFQSPGGVDPQMPQLPFRQPVPHGLGAMFEKYGVKLNADLVLDRERNVVGLGLSARGLVQVSIPTLPLLTGVNQESILTKDIDAVVFPYSGSLTLTDEALRSADLTITKLIETADSAVTRQNLADTRVEDLGEPTEDEEPGPHLVAVALDGKLPSAFEDGRVSEDGARVLVVSNGEFLFPNQRSGYSPEYARLGGLFFLNTMDWLVQDESLIRIRNKGLPRILEPVDPDTQRWLQVANIAGVPAGVAALGLLWLLVRIFRKRAIAERFRTAKTS